MEVHEILRIGMQTASGLAAAHAHGLVHRDVKPANILLAEGIERVTLTDFGLARAVDDASLTRIGVIAGTLQYMSPEQARGKAVDARSGLFSLIVPSFPQVSASGGGSALPEPGTGDACGWRPAARIFWHAALESAVVKDTQRLATNCLPDRSHDLAQTFARGAALGPPTNAQMTAITPRL
jgi:serine/threonine protein kinase